MSSSSSKPPNAASSQVLDVIIVGAGITGLYTLHILRQSGLLVKILEAEDDLGGNWYQNRYPGCRNDTSVPAYEYPVQEVWWSWSELYPTRDEILNYLRYFAEKLNLRKDIQFNTKITKATWDNNDKTWHLTDGDGPMWRARFSIFCTGYLQEKFIPDFKGLSAFKGACVHTSEWPADLSIVDKRVGVFGTGASGIQVIEAIAPQVSHLSVFQRTPNLALPINQRSLDERKDQDADHSECRQSPSGSHHSPVNRSAHQDDPEARMKLWEALLNEGLGLWLGNYEDLLTDPETNTQVYNVWRESVRRRISDPSLQEKLAPRTPPHAFGSKRPCLEKNYFEIFEDPKVNLIDLRETPIEEITEHGVVTTSKSYELDVLIMATGFDAVTGSMYSMDIRGIDGISIQEKWADGVWTYLGMLCSGFPNMFFLNGPQAPTALAVSPRLAQIQVPWIADCIGYMQKNNRTTVDTTRELEGNWKGIVRKFCNESLISETNSWYMGQNTGRPRESLCFTGGLPKYQEYCKIVTENRYNGLIMS